MYSVGLWQVQVGFARAMRAAFTHHHQFKWDPNPDISKISVYDQWPLAPTKYPTIIISTGNSQLLRGHRGIGEEHSYTKTSPISIDGATHLQESVEYKSGTNEIPIIVTVQARSSYEVLQIADWCALFIRSFAAEKFRREGLEVSDITASPPSAQLLGDDPLYTVQLTVTCLTEFKRVIPIAVAQTVDAICLTGIFTIMPDGVTVGTYS